MGVNGIFHANIAISAAYVTALRELHDIINNKTTNHKRNVALQCL